MAEKRWKSFYTGTIVRWNGQLWIVGRVIATGLELIDLTHCNCSATPTETWPEDKVI